LSVYEERLARPEWGGGVTPSLIAAYSAGRLRPVSRLNDGFVHPRYDHEVILSYALSAYVFEMLEARKGMPGIRALLAGYRNGTRTPQVMQAVYGLDSAAMDSTFDSWFRAKFAREFAAVRGEVRSDAAGEPRTELAGPLRDVLTAAATAAQQKQWPLVVQAAKRGIALFPAWAEPGSGYHFLVTAYAATGDSAGLRDALTAITVRNGDAVDENITLGGLLLAARDTTGAIAALDALLWPIRSTARCMRSWRSWRSPDVRGPRRFGRGVRYWRWDPPTAPMRTIDWHRRWPRPAMSPRRASMCCAPSTSPPTSRQRRTCC
ncbi:MAG: hypothetical protein H7099_15330, partial [Gemmatimonadaceae bacterium]|nr:hypothetical protein [Gemmatimonadaceae bacterium]